MPTQFSRRTFLVGGTLVPVVSVFNSAPADSGAPWYQKTFLWGQTNINEADPPHYDLNFWRGYWKKTGVQGIIVNAGGIVAYYPSAYPLHHRARFLGDRDLFGEVLKAARAEGLVVLARMDCNRAHEDFYQAHPDWFAQTAEGKPVRAADLYVTCIHSPYYDEYIPGLLREIAGRYHPEGFADNSWSGLDRDTICHCPYCREKFQAASGHELPSRPDWDAAVYRQWIQWNYARRIEIWDLYNRVAREVGGKDCLWIGMLADNPAYEARRFRDLKAICSRSHLVLLDHQGRNASEGFENNCDAGKRLHGLLGWDKFIPESMAMYTRNPSFRKAANAPAEARLWMLEGMAGGIQTWWHHVGAVQEDRRQFDLAAELTRWAGAHRQFLTNREPVASIGLVWSQANAEFYGREEAEVLTSMPYRGFVRALVSARLPYIPVHADHIEREAPRLALLILPSLGAMSNGQVESVRKFVQKGGSLVVTGETGMCDEWGDRRPAWPFAEILGVDALAGPKRETRDRRAGAEHSYLRLLPDMEGGGSRHDALQGFEKTNILPFGGSLVAVKARPDAAVIATCIPDFPIYPPETSWMREPRTDRPCLVARRLPQGGRAVYFAADIDRSYAAWGLPDHAHLLAGAISWAAGPTIPVRVEGPGVLDSSLYIQGSVLILHIVNLTTATAWPGVARDVVEVGPLAVRLKRRAGSNVVKCRSLVTDKSVAVAQDGEWVKVELPSISHHDLLVFE
ncbi:MAG: alpha-amylase family protein [Acidobacteriota bacterium]